MELHAPQQPQKRHVGKRFSRPGTRKHKAIVAVASRDLERSRKACLPARVSKDAMANKVRDVIADVLEEDPDTFGTGPYRTMVEQIISYLWPCEPIS
jgi:hypothetical protein